MGSKLYWHPKSKTLQRTREAKGLFYIDSAYRPEVDGDNRVSINTIDQELLLLETEQENIDSLIDRVSELPKVSHNSGFSVHVEGRPQKNLSFLEEEGKFEDFCSEIMAARFLRSKGWNTIRVISPQSGTKAPDLVATKKQTRLFEVKSKHQSSLEERISTDYDNRGLNRLISAEFTHPKLSEWLDGAIKETIEKTKAFNALYRTHHRGYLLVDCHTDAATWIPLDNPHRRIGLANGIRDALTLNDIKKYGPYFSDFPGMGPKWIRRKRS